MSLNLVRLSRLITRFATRLDVSSQTIPSGLRRSYVAWCADDEVAVVRESGLSQDTMQSWQDDVFERDGVERQCLSRHLES